jgi:hypothetical protein
MGTKNKRHVLDKATKFSLEYCGSHILAGDYLTAAQSIPHIIGLRVTCVFAKTAYGTI